METERLGGVAAIDPDDARIQAFVAAHSARPTSRSPLMVGIEGPDGFVYRGVAADGPEEFHLLAEFLGNLGFVPREPVAAPGFDAVYCRPEPLPFPEHEC